MYKYLYFQERKRWNSSHIICLFLQWEKLSGFRKWDSVYWKHIHGDADNAPHAIFYLRCCWREGKMESSLDKFFWYYSTMNRNALFSRQYTKLTKKQENVKARNASVRSQVLVRRWNRNKRTGNFLRFFYSSVDCKLAWVLVTHLRLLYTMTALFCPFSYFTVLPSSRNETGDAFHFSFTIFAQFERHT